MRIIDDLGIVQDDIKVHYDSQSIIYLSRDYVHHVRTMHIDVRYPFICDIIEESTPSCKRSISQIIR